MYYVYKTIIIITEFVYTGRYKAIEVTLLDLSLFIVLREVNSSYATRKQVMNAAIVIDLFLDVDHFELNIKQVIHMPQIRHTVSHGERFTNLTKLNTRSFTKHSFWRFVIKCEYTINSQKTFLLCY